MGTKNEKWYSVDELTPFEFVHPGEILSEELKARGISQKVFAKEIGIQASHLSALIHGSRSFTPAVAGKIASGLDGVPAETWLRLQKDYNRESRRSRIKSSMLVSGYGVPVEMGPASVLAQPDEFSYGSREHVRLTIPSSDREILESLADRLGWTVDNL